MDLTATTTDTRPEKETLARMIASLVTVIRAPTSFVLVSGCSSGDLETNGFEERVQAIADLTVEGTALFFR